MILIVDDQLDTCEPLRRLLTRTGHQVHCLTHGRDALQFLSTQRPDLILLDLMMPDLSGFDVLQSIREKPATANTPVLMFSASGSREIRQRAAKLGANDFLTKGTLEWPELLGRINGILASIPHARPTDSAYA
ncbi:MAG TPA: response regulator [Tepidisphaeraceae bacterium]|jgi:DNA-binding response OmpR family regulator|nr:response regulator [Tepidisphaeraceae bacterium]